MNVFNHLSAIGLAALLGTGVVIASRRDDHDHDVPPTPRPSATRTADTHDDHDAHADGHDEHGDAHDGHDDHDDHAHGGDGHRDEVTLTAEAIRRQNITLATATRRTLVPTFVAPGRVAFDAEAMAHVGVAVRGRVVEINVRAGDAVEKGADLLVVESPELGRAQGELVQRRSAVAVAGSAVPPARRAYERAQALFDKSEGIALAEVQRREAELRSAEGATVTATAAVTVAEDALRLLGMSGDEIGQIAKTDEIAPRLAVRSPLAGRVIEREVTLGELVSPEDEALLVIADLTNVWVLAEVQEGQLARVGVGSTARVQVAASKVAVEGRVTYVASSLDPSTRTGRVRIAVPNADASLRPGMFARVEIASAGAGAAAGEAVVAVPEEAVQRVEGRDVVFVPVPGEPNTFAARAVSAAKPVGGLVAIAGGLAEGERFVATNAFILKADLGKSGAAHEH